MVPTKKVNGPRSEKFLPFLSGERLLRTGINRQNHKVLASSDTTISSLIPKEDENRKKIESTTH